MSDPSSDEQAQRAIDMWRAGATRSDAIDAMPRDGSGRAEWDCLLGCSDDRFAEGTRSQLALTKCGLTASLTEMGCALGGADSAVFAMLVLDEELLLLFAYDMDDGNNEMLVLRCEREPIEDKYVHGDIEDWDSFDDDSRFPHSVEYVGFGTGCAELLQGACLVYLERLFKTHTVVAASPIMDYHRYDPQEGYCFAPRGSGYGERFSDVSYLVLQSELDARTEDATECEYEPRATDAEKEVCVTYNGLLLAAYSLIREDLEQMGQGIEALPRPGELARRDRGRSRYPHILLRELVQQSRAALRHPKTRGRLCPPTCKAHGPTDGLLRFLYEACPIEVFQCVLEQMDGEPEAVEDDADDAESDKSDEGEEEDDDEDEEDDE